MVKRWKLTFINENSLYQLESYNLALKIENVKMAMSLYSLKIHILLKERDDLSTNREAIESLSIEITNSDSKNIIFNVAYRPSDCDTNVCESYFKNIFFKGNVIRKNKRETLYKPTSC